jgi:hypothetical protein
MLRLVLRKYSRFLLPANEPFGGTPQVLCFCFLSSQTCEGAKEATASQDGAPAHVNRLRPF